MKDIIKKKRTFWGTVGFILFLYGAIWTISFALNDGSIIGIISAGISVILGILMISWIFGD